MQCLTLGDMRPRELTVQQSRGESQGHSNNSAAHARRERSAEDPGDLTLSCLPGSLQSCGKESLLSIANTLTLPIEQHPLDLTEIQ